jgi:arylsulfatase A-like enzyme
MVTRRGFLSAAGALAAPRPNLLFLVADQWRGQALPSAGDLNLIAPNLSRLAREGVDFQRAYTSYPVCCPSRAAMLTGRFPHAAGVPRNHMRLPLSETTMSGELQRAGYRTGYIGKWHLDGNENPGFVPPSRRRGFDYWAAYNVAHRHYGSVYFRDTPDPVRAAGFEPDDLTRLAIEFIRDGKQPFFLYVSWVAPHPPLTPPARHAIYDPERIRLRPNVPAGHHAQTRKNAAAYYGLCSAVDENLGRLLAELDRRKLSEDTIVVFTSDHGYMLGSHGLDTIDEPYEEACRTPLLIRYPRRIKARTERSAVISNVDYAPTLLSLCGLQPTPGMQGTDLSGWLTGRRGNAPGAVYAEGSLGSREEWRMVVRGSDKLIVNSSFEATRLFRLDTDPYELNNLVKDRSQSGRRDELLALLRQWLWRTRRVSE